MKIQQVAKKRKNAKKKQRQQQKNWRKRETSSLVLFLLVCGGACALPCRVLFSSHPTNCQQMVSSKVWPLCLIPFCRDFHAVRSCSSSYASLPRRRALASRREQEEGGLTLSTTWLYSPFIVPPFTCAGFELWLVRPWPTRLHPDSFISIDHEGGDWGTFPAPPLTEHYKKAAHPQYPRFLR